MKRIKLSLICTAALILAMPLTGCMHAESGNAEKHGVEQKIVTQTEDNDECPDGKCPKIGDECPDGKCPKIGDVCPDGRCPKRRLPPPVRRGNGKRAERMPAPISESKNTGLKGSPLATCQG